jgi:hypothetical protein
VFAVYPLEDHIDVSEKTRQAKAYEDTVDNHRPEDRAAMDQLESGTSRIPDNRTELWKWVNYFLAAIRSMFGESCPLLGKLSQLKNILNRDTYFRNFHATEWRCYFWRYHLAVRAFFDPSPDVDRLEEFAEFISRARRGIPVAHVEVPRELINQLTPNPNGSQKRGGGGGGGSHAPQGNPRTPTGAPAGIHDGSNIGRRWGKEWGNLLKSAVNEATEAVKNAGGEWGLNRIYAGNMEAAFGGMMRLVKPSPSGGRSPCPRLFTYGKCRTSGCRNSHNLEHDPTPDQSRAFVGWVKAKCQEIKSHPNA